MTLSGHTKPFAVLGHPIGHTLSPVMHNAAFTELGMDAIYMAFDVDPDRLLEVLPAMRDMGFGGVNLTVPLKEVAFKGFKDLAPSAQRVGAVNTVEFLDNGKLRGHSTDGEGFLLSLNEEFALPDLSELTVFVLGTGGAGRSLALTCADAAAKKLLLGDIELDRARKVASEVQDTSEAQTETGGQESWAEFTALADLVIHATPVGMKPGEQSLLGPETFRKDQFAFDLIYMYPETPFMKAATEGGARAANGLGMLLHQGAAAFKIWTNREPAVKAMRVALEQSVYKK